MWISNKTAKRIGNKQKEKRYEVDVDIKFTEVVYATNKSKAKQQVKYSFLDEYNLNLTDEEITDIRQ